MSEYVYFLGRFHVLVLHLPIGILLLAAFLEYLSRRPRYRAIEPAMQIVWLTGAVAALVTVALGYLHATEGGFDTGAVNAHRWNGTALTLLAFLIWAWRAESPRTFAKVWKAAVIGTIALLFTTGHYGGNLTHGSTYLVQYAPAPLRSMAGLAEEFQPRPPVTDVAAADIYLDVVAPALQQRCGGCHNDDKHRGDLSLVSHARIMAGGESGPVLVAGDAVQSDLYRRITLPEDHVDYMPKDGKTPLNADEVAAIAWWIDAGAPQAGTLAELDAPPEIKARVAAALGL